MGTHGLLNETTTEAYWGYSCPSTCYLGLRMLPETTLYHHNYYSHQLNNPGPTPTCYLGWDPTCPPTTRKEASPGWHSQVERPLQRCWTGTLLLSITRLDRPSREQGIGPTATKETKVNPYIHRNSTLMPRMSNSSTENAILLMTAVASCCPIPW